MLKITAKLCSVMIMLSLVACANNGSKELSEQLPPLETVGRKVLLVNANRQIERYQIAEQSFSSLFGKSELTTLDLMNEREPLELLLDQLNTETYKAVYCIGAKSLGLIDYIDAGLPVVYSSVLNWRKFHNNIDYYGVASEVSLVAQLTWFKYFFPELQKVGVFYSEKNEALIMEAKDVAKSLGMTLLAEEVELNSDFQGKAGELLPDVQALWLISDLAVLAPETRVQTLFDLAKAKHVPVLTYNELFIEMGALLSIEADLPTTGRQAALLMRDVLNNGPKLQSVTYPAGSRIILNQTTLESSGLNINEDALDSLSDIRD